MTGLVPRNALDEGEHEALLPSLISSVVSYVTLALLGEWQFRCSISRALRISQVAIYSGAAASGCLQGLDWCNSHTISLSPGACSDGSLVGSAFAEVDPLGGFSSRAFVDFCSSRFFRETLPYFFGPDMKLWGGGEPYGTTHAGTDRIWHSEAAPRHCVPHHGAA